jgi:hypothetical protein
MHNMPKTTNEAGREIDPEWLAKIDPSQDPEWVLYARMFYGDDNTDPNEAYDELAERDRQHDIAS